MARPKADTVVFRLALTLHLERDRDLIEWFDAHPPGEPGRQEALKALLRGGLPRGKMDCAGVVDDANVLEALLALVR